MRPALSHHQQPLPPHRPAGCRPRGTTSGPSGAAAGWSMWPATMRPSSWCWPAACACTTATRCAHAAAWELVLVLAGCMCLHDGHKVRARSCMGAGAGRLHVPVRRPQGAHMAHAAACACSTKLSHTPACPFLRAHAHPDWSGSRGMGPVPACLAAWVVHGTRPGVCCRPRARPHSLPAAASHHQARCQPRPPPWQPQGARRPHGPQWRGPRRWARQAGCSRTLGEGGARAGRGELGASQAHMQPAGGLSLPLMPDGERRLGTGAALAGAGAGAAQPTIGRVRPLLACSRGLPVAEGQGGAVWARHAPEDSQGAQRDLPGASSHLDQ